MKHVKFVICALVAASGAAAAETPAELWRDAYTITWESGYETVEECTPDSGVVLSNGLIFICDSYEYVYHYGGAFIASKDLSYQGRSVSLNYLCLEDEEECLSGRLVRAR